MTDPHPLPLLTPMQLLTINTRLGLEHRKLSKAIDSALHRHGLTHAKFEILNALVSATTPMTLLPLAAQLQRHWTTTSSTVDRLEAQGLTMRHTNPHNRRQSLLEPTAAGRSTHCAAQQSLHTLIESTQLVRSHCEASTECTATSLPTSITHGLFHGCSGSIDFA